MLLVCFNINRDARFATRLAAITCTNTRVCEREIETVRKRDIRLTLRRTEDGGAGGQEIEREGRRSRRARDRERRTEEQEGKR